MTTFDNYSNWGLYDPDDDKQLEFDFGEDENDLPKYSYSSIGSHITTSWTGTYQGALSSSIVFDDYSLESRLEAIEDVLTKIQDRFAVLEEQDFGDDFPTLKEAYDKFRMLEKLAGKKK